MPPNVFINALNSPIKFSPLFLWLNSFNLSILHVTGSAAGARLSLSLLGSALSEVAEILDSHSLYIIPEQILES